MKKGGRRRSIGLITGDMISIADRHSDLLRLVYRRLQFDLSLRDREPVAHSIALTGSYQLNWIKHIIFET